jgi:hypothetical protein
LKKEREREKRGGVHQTNTIMWSSSQKKERGRDKIKSTENGKRFPRRSMAKLLPVNG